MRSSRVLCHILAAVWSLTGLVALADHHAGPYGAWDLTVPARNGERPSWVKLFQVGGEPAADFVGATGGKHRATDVEVNENSFKWTVGETRYQATLADGKLAGELTRGDRRRAFAGVPCVRRVDLSGTWDVQIDIGDRTMQRELKLEHEGDNIRGTYGGDEIDELTLADVSLEGDRLRYTIRFDNNGQEFQVEYDAKVAGDRYDGTLAVAGTEFEGDVRATRRRSWGKPIELINQKDLANWDFQENGRENHWKVVDSVLDNKAAGWNIFTKQRFKDYKLRADVKVPAGGNSGIYINGRYEVQVEDSYGKPASEGSMGAIYGRAVPVTNPSKPAGEWQTFEITFVDYWVTVELNGTKVVDNVLIEGITGGALDSNEAEPGPIMLQGDHGPIAYRNLVVTPLE